MTKYIDFYGLTKLQREIMRTIELWCKDHKTPIPHKEVLLKMKEKLIPEYSTVHGLRALIRKGYIRKAIVISNKTFYVMLRSI